jgi:hypothetical protein
VSCKTTAFLPFYIIYYYKGSFFVAFFFVLRQEKRRKLLKSLEAMQKSANFVRHSAQNGQKTSIN